MANEAMVAGPPMHVVLAFKGTTPGGTSYNSPYREDFVLETSPLKDWSYARNCLVLLF